jgi:hypothetical protein
MNIHSMDQLNGGYFMKLIFQALENKTMLKQNKFHLSLVELKTRSATSSGRAKSHSV